MKRLICLMLCFLMTLLSGCHSESTGETAFYYCRDPQQHQYFEDGSVIHAEYRDLLGHRDDLQYMVGLYLAGPMEEGLLSPFPKTTRLLSIQKEQDEIIVELSEHGQTIPDSAFSLACACLTLTCVNFTDCQTVTVNSGDRSMTMHADQIILLDTLPQQETSGG